MAGRGASQASGAGSNSGGFRDRSGIASLVALALNLALVLIDTLGRAAVQAAQARAEIACHAVRQRKRIETNVQFAAPMHAPWPLDLGYGSLNVTARGNHDAAVG